MLVLRSSSTGLKQAGATEGLSVACFKIFFIWFRSRTVPQLTPVKPSHEEFDNDTFGFLFGFLFFCPKTFSSSGTMNKQSQLLFMTWDKVAVYAIEKATPLSFGTSWKKHRHQFAHPGHVYFDSPP